MSLKTVVDGMLKDKNRSLSWLALEMAKTFEGLKLSLTKETIKYKDIKAMAKILDVSPGEFFENLTTSSYPKTDPLENISDVSVNYNDLKSNLKSSREMIVTLRDQLKDKERIISLLNNK